MSVLRSAFRFLAVAVRSGCGDAERILALEVNR
jgi:hypothetical protein